MNRFDIVIFDLDGTLTDTFDSLKYVCLSIDKYSLPSISDDQLKIKLDMVLRSFARYFT